MFRFAEKFILLALFVFVSGALAVSHEQLLLVVADDMNASTALLQRYDYKDGAWHKTGKNIHVNIGRNGLGWGLGSIDFPHAGTDPLKYEGDGRAPAGIFDLGPVFGYANKMDTMMPYRQAREDLICIDDERAESYNHIVPISQTQQFGSFEWMKREDGLYRMGIVVGHNTEALPGRGSCVFLHIERAPGSGTAGCTSMAAPELHTIIRWLDPDKGPLLVQVPAGSLPAVRKMFVLPKEPAASSSVQ